MFISPEVCCFVYLINPLLQSLSRPHMKGLSLERTASRDYERNQMIKIKRQDLFIHLSVYEQRDRLQKKFMSPALFYARIPTKDHLIVRNDQVITTLVKLQKFLYDNLNASL